LEHQEDKLPKAFHLQLQNAVIAILTTGRETDMSFAVLLNVRKHTATNYKTMICQWSKSFIGDLENKSRDCNKNCQHPVAGIVFLFYPFVTVALKAFGCL